MITVLLSSDGNTYSATFTGTTIQYSDYLIKNSTIPRVQIDCGTRNGGSFSAEFAGLSHSMAEDIKSKKYMKLSIDGDVRWVGYLDSANTTVNDQNDETVSCTYNDILSLYGELKFCADPKSAYENDDPHAYQKTSYSDASTAKLLYKKTKESFASWRDTHCNYHSDAWYKAQEYYDKYYQKEREYNDTVYNQYGWKIKFDNTYYICDREHQSKSIVHILFGFLPNFTLHVDFDVLTKPKFICINGTEYVVETLLKLLEQNGIGWSVDCYDIYLVNLSSSSSATATNIEVIEKGVTVNEKPYIEYEMSDIRYVTDYNDSNIRRKLLPKDLWSTAEEISSGNINSNNFISAILGFAKSLFLRIGISDYSILFAEYNWFSSGMSVYPEPQEIGTCDDGTKMYEPVMGMLDFNDKLSQYQDMAECEVTSCDFKCTVDSNDTPNVVVTIGEMLDDGKFNYIFTWNGSQSYVKNIPLGFFDNANKKGAVLRFDVSADTTFINYGAVKEAQFSKNDGNAEKCRFIFDDATALAYDTARIWKQDSKKKTYNFYSPNDLNVGDVITLQGVSNDALMISSKMEHFDEWGGADYVAVPVPRVFTVTKPSTFIPLSNDITESFSSNNTVITLDRDVIPCDKLGNPKDTTAVEVRISGVLGKDISITANGSSISVTADSVTVEGVQYGTGTFSAHIPVTGWASGVNRSTVSITIGDDVYTKYITKVLDGQNGSDGQNGQNGAYMQYQYAIGTKISYPTSESSWSDSPPSRALATGEYVWQRQRNVQP